MYLSKRPIEPGEELTVDYKFAAEAAPTPCHCGSVKCRRTINLKPGQAHRIRRWLKQ